MKKAVVFLQRRAHRAGAQTCLLRLLRQPALRALNPVVVTAERGWLAGECERAAITCLVEEFPSSRSLSGRLFRNALFARRIARRLRAMEIEPVLVHGNDFLEGLLTRELGKRLQVRTALFLRSAPMTRGDFDKYRCADADLVVAVGDELQQRAGGWAPGKSIALIHDGMEAEDFLPPKPPPPAFPAKILVIGSPLDAKGWADAAAAFRELQGNPAFPHVSLSFTGSQPGNVPLQGLHATFLAREENFRDLARRFDLAINPSWMESFGMAAMEVLAAGVPLLSTRTGVIDQVVSDERYLVKPRDAGEMRDKLRALAAGWPESALDVAECQRRIRERFLIERSARKLAQAYAELLPRQHGPESLADPRLAK